MNPTSTKRGLACVGERTLYLINPAERDYTRHRFVFWFGQIGTIYASVWANNLDDGLEIAGDWLKEYEPDMLCDDEVQEEYERLMEEGYTEEEAQDAAIVDTLQLENGSYLASWDWGIDMEDPTRAQLVEFIGETL